MIRRIHDLSRRLAWLLKVPSVLAVMLAAQGTQLRAEDIDIYAALPVQGDLPNVLIVLDSSANWSSAIGQSCSLVDDPTYAPSVQERGTKMAIEKCALYNLFHALPTRPDGSALFNVGLMLFNLSPAADSGGYPRKAFTPLTAANKASLKALVKSLDVQSDKGNNAAFAKSLYEAYLYFTGGVPYRGTAGTRWDTGAVVNGAYKAPQGGGCARNFVIFIANGGPGEVTDGDAKALLAAAGGDTAPIVYPSSYVKTSDQSNWADEFARFMRNSGADGSQGIVTHAVAVTGASSDGLFPNFMRGVAAHGGGSFYAASDATTLQVSLLEIFNQVQAVNSVFSSASLPLSATAQGAFQSQVFLGLFRPDAQGHPRWLGNLRQYQVGYDPATDTLSLLDSQGRAAVNAATGFLSPNAQSYWTAPSTFWVNAASGTPPSASDAPDGDVVEKGGAAQRLRERFESTQSTRKLYTCLTCLPGTPLSSASFETANTAITAAMLGTDAASRNALIDWVRGIDNAGDETGPGGATTVRPSIHGDVLHSRPLPIDYGGTTGVVVFYGANDGTFRAVRGARDGSGAGDELWGFIAPEHFGKLRRLRADDPLVRFPNTPAGLSASARDYFFDGPTGVYRNGSTNTVIVYPTMRRGGRALYAIDVSDPAQPRLQWKKTAADLPVLGQTWSEPKVAKLKGHSRPVLVMGAGYDADAEDADPPAGTTVGNAILVLDALDGTLLRQFDGPARSVAADVTLVDTDFDGYIDRAYAADLGASLWRLDFETASGPAGPGGWAITHLADLNDGVGSRKFFFAPDVVVTRSFAALMLGSGDREKPLKTFSNDRFFVVRDTAVGKGAPASWSTLTESSLPTLSSGTTSTWGCSLAFSGAGEKVVTGATSIGGKTYFSTNRPTPPAPDACVANLGEARAYEMPLFCQPATSTRLTGGGLPPTPISGVMAVQYTPPGATSVSTRLVPFVFGGTNPKASALEPTRIVPVIPAKRSRPYWYVESDR